MSFFSRPKLPREGKTISAKIISALFVITLALFSGLAVAQFYYPRGLEADIWLLYLVWQTKAPLFDALAQTLTPLGLYEGVIPLLLIVTGILILQRKWFLFSYVSFAGLGAVILSHGAKRLFHRPRPHFSDHQLSWPTSPAFPSGHAIASMILLVIVVTLTWKTPWRWLGLTGGILFILIIAWTRLYLGVHYPSDIIAGWSLAIAWGIAVYRLLTFAQWRRQSHLLAENEN